MSAVSDVKPGDQVSWQWGSGQPSGVAAEVKADEISMTTARGAEVTKKGDEENPAVKVDRSGHNVVKKASELEVENEGPEHADGDDDKDEPPKEEENEVKAEKLGEKAAEKKNGEPKPRGRPKKSETPKPKVSSEKKVDGKRATNGTGGEEKQQKGKRGRKPGSGGKSATQAKRDAKPKKRAATESGEPRRSKRVKT